ncbi:MAG TPA: ABC transporter ATP-binding protein, partial [Miltoncostaeaceae bacterium]|nr:ABC transporter ATP-binding protein [Miltoncostaeaceae bacterium]
MSVIARVRGLRFAHGADGPPALRGVDLDVAAGEFLLLTGPSGGGKSTLLRALCGSVPHFHGGRIAGSVSVAGLDTLRTPPARIARVAGLLFQDPETQAVLGAVDRDVAFGLENAGCPPADIPARVRQALALVGAGHLHDRRIAELSGGERQRVALAAVLACRPPLLLLDEPTSQLDERGADDLIAILRRLADDGTAVVVAEHRSERLSGRVDRHLRVSDGRIVGDGVPVPPGAPRTGPSGPAKRAEEGGERLALVGIRAGHGDRTVLDGLDFAATAGTVTAIHGPNGCGKTLLCRVAAGLHAPADGLVRLDGRVVTDLSAQRRFPHLALVTQDPGRHLLTERVRDEVAYALVHLGVPADERTARVATLLEQLDLTEHADRHPLDLSV